MAQVCLILLALFAAGGIFPLGIVLGSLPVMLFAVAVLIGASMLITAT